jgi:putative ABC transport system permease protein
MNVIGRFTIRSLRRNRKWTVVTIIGIIISTAMITAVSTFCSSFFSLMQNEAIAGSGNWHASVSKVREQDIKTIENASFVGEVMLSRDIGYAQLKDSKNTAKPYLFIKQYDANSSKNFPTTLVSGRMPKNDSELVLPQHLQTNGGITYHIGDKLTLDIGKRTSEGSTELLQNTPFQFAEAADADTGNPGSTGETFVSEFTKTYTVVGIIKRPNFEPNSAPGYTAITYLNTKALVASDVVNVSILSTQLNHSFYNKMDSLAQSIGKDKTAVSYNSDVLRYYGVVASDNTENTIYIFAFIMILIIMIASVSLIYNAFAISVSERTRQLGMLASVGATKRQKSQNVYFEGFLIGLVGIPLGILAGIAGVGITIAVIHPLISSFSTFLTSGLQLVVSPMSIVVAIVFAVLTIFISAWIPARRASKIMPIDAIRQSKEIKLTGKAVKTSRLTRALFGFEGEIALKNLKRNRKKYRATVLSLIISLVLFLTVSYYADLAGKSAVSASSGINYDMAVNYYWNTPLSEKKAVSSKIAALDLVTDSANVTISSGAFLMSAAQLPETTKQLIESAPQKEYKVGAQIYSLDHAAFEKYAQNVGVNPKDYENPAQPKVILVNYGVSVIKGKHAAGQVVAMKPGEKLNFTAFTSGANKQQKSIDFELGALTDKRPMGMLIGFMGSVSVVISEEVYTSLSSQLTNNNHSNQENLYLNTKNSDELQKQIDNLTSGLSKGKAYITNIAADAKREQNTMLVLGVFVYGFITLISLICIANIFNTISTNIALRRKEFAMLRSVGMTPKGFNKMIRFESIFYGLKALLYGLPISVAVAFLLYYFQESTLQFEFSLPWLSYAVAIALIFVIVTSTMLYSSSKIKNENIIDALKEENA